MAKGGKGGGSKGSGGVGVVGKGKKGGSCSQGQVAACFLKSDYDLILAAFNAAIQSTSRSSGCDPGSMRVCLDLPIAQRSGPLSLSQPGASQRRRKAKVREDWPWESSRK